MPSLLLSIDYTATQVGVVFCIGPLMKFIVPLLINKFFTMNNRFFIIANIFTLIGVLSFYFTIFDFVAYFFASLFFSIFHSTLVAYVDVIAVEKLKENYGRVRLFGSLGFIFSTLFVAKFSLGVYFILNLSVICAILIFFSSLFIIQDSSYKNKKSEKEEPIFIRNDIFLWLGFFLMQLSFAPFYGFFTVYERSYNVSLEFISYLWSFGVICEVFMFYFQSPILRKFNVYSLIKLCVFITFIRWLLLVLFPKNGFILFFSQSLHIFSFALYHSSCVYYLNMIYKNSKFLSQQFFLGISYGLGNFIGYFISGAIYDINKEFLYIFASFCALLSFFSFYFKNFSKN